MPIPITEEDTPGHFVDVTEWSISRERRTPILLLTNMKSCFSFLDPDCALD